MFDFFPAEIHGAILVTNPGLIWCYTIQDIFLEAILGVIWDVFLDANWDVNLDANCDANWDVD